MWTYLLGPFLSLLPRRWRQALPFFQSVNWRPAAILSGMAESVIALVALMYWYWFSMSTWISRLLDLALVGKTAPGTTDHHIATAALLVWSTHPVTWGIAFFGLEGMARVCAAFTDTILGTFPLYLLEKIFSDGFSDSSGGSSSGCKVFAKSRLFLCWSHPRQSYDGQVFAGSRRALRR